MTQQYPDFQPSGPAWAPTPTQPTNASEGSFATAGGGAPGPHGGQGSGAFSSAPTASTAPYGQAQVFATRPRKRRSLVGGFVATALLSAGLGGGVGAGTVHLMAQDGAMPEVSATQVVQADPANPDWSVTAEAVADAVVAIQVSGRGGSGQGSGVILDGYGNTVTNNHVIAGAGAGSEITVVIDNRRYGADVVGTDPSTDLAVIRLVDPPADLSTITFGDSTQLRVGDPAMAIGNPLGLSDTVTTGIVSAIDRPVTTRAVSSTVGDTGNATVVTAAIQTSAAINPGNSGGALVNSAGELIGITSSIATLTSNASGQGGNIGIGFAIPSNQVRSVVDQLMTDGVARHAQLGVSASDVQNSSVLGAQVAEVVPGSPASEADLRVGDVVTAVDSRPVSSAEALVAIIRSAEVGQTVTLTVLRQGTEVQVSAVLGSAS